jgi:steroid 5-alpha reductase family enzyme
MSEPASPSPSRAGAFALVTLAYLAAVAAAVAVGWLFRDEHPLVAAALADLVGTLVVFAFSAAFDNTSFYDPYWSVAPVPLALFYLVVPALTCAASAGDAGACAPEALEAAADLPSVADATVRAIVGGGIVTLYAARLTFNWARGWRGLGHEDWRYAELRAKTGAGYWAVSLGALHLMPTVMVFGGCLSLYVTGALASRPFGPLDVAAAAVALLAIGIEALADEQLRAFVRARPPAEAVLDRGLWAVSRHPNYFGEVLFWWGLYLMALAAAPEAWWAVVGPLAITLLFVGVSIPLIERRMLARRPSFAERQKRVSMLVPWPPRAPRG